ncbi:MoaD/ThiS family protein [Desulfobacula sp.]|uniref:MoaD/ThiS family protein n=1 Tax=Desulfobacula sp. TaxID=2593537 RepID=UPI002619BC79|nr:MoaD/ThiS family protein [Desulfobacula sp.]
MTIIIPITHRIYANGQKQIETDSKNLKEAIMALYHACPDMKGHVMDKNNRLYAGMEIAVNDDIVFPWNPEKPLNHGDEIRISSIITGG